MLTSAGRERIFNGTRDAVVSVTWKRAKNHREAFIDEYIQMQKYGLEKYTGKSYNKIWSPGRKYSLKK